MKQKRELPKLPPPNKETVDYYRQHYKEYLKTPWWQELNDALIDSNPKASCWICEKTNTLLLHHISYENLFAERLFIDVYILCFKCHTRTHFTLSGKKIAIERKVLLKRMKLLRITYGFRNFKLGSWLNKIFLTVS